MLALKHHRPLWHHSNTIYIGTSEKKYTTETSFFFPNICVLVYFFVCKPTFDDWQAAPLDFFPAAAQQPRIDFLQQLGQVLWIRLHDLVKLSKLAEAHKHKVWRDTTLVISGWGFYLLICCCFFCYFFLASPYIVCTYLSRPEEDFGQSKLEVSVIQSQSFEQSLKR